MEALKVLKPNIQQLENRLSEETKNQVNTIKKNRKNGKQKKFSL